MICVSIAGKNPQECIKALEGVEFAEIRMETISGIDEAGVRQIFSSKAKLIATCRPGKMDEAERKMLLLAAIASGAAYVDVEVDAADPYKQDMVAAAKKKGCQVIVSFHDYERTPPREELVQIVNWCFESGADVAKIACKANSKRDAARLLGLLDGERKVVAVGIGPEGRITRLVAPLLGSPFTYASEGKGKETAEGQMAKGEMEKIIREMSDA